MIIRLQDWVTIIAVLIISFSLVMVIHELSLSADDAIGCI